MDFGNASVVSFDLFDTLLLRPFEDPNVHLELLETRAQELSSGGLTNFRAARERAKATARERTGEEVTLEQRYRALQRDFDLSEQVMRALMDAELETEQRLLFANPRAKPWFAEALAVGKRVCIVSDTFYPRPFIEQVLHDHGYDGWHRLYLSSEIGMLKRSGRLFAHLISDLGVDASQVLHIGDDAISDVKRAREHGIAVSEQPRHAELFARHARGAREFRYEDSVTHSLVRGVLAHRFAEQCSIRDLPLGFVGATRQDLGHSLLGPMLLGFVTWLGRRSLTHGTDRLYFLSRDGDVMKRAYDLVREQAPELPPATYLYASRRGTCIPALETASDVLELLDVPFSSTPLVSLLEQRFGLTPAQLSDTTPADFGLPAWMFPVSLNAHREELRELLQRLTPRILGLARGERDTYSKYLESVGLPRAHAPAVVDIGHRGSLQRALGRILNDPQIRGFYFSSALDADALRELHHESYLGSQPGDAAANRAYESRVSMFELLFLNDQGSFLCMDRRGSEWMPHTVEDRSDEARRQFARAVHEGALGFVRTATNVLEGQSLRFAVAASEAIRPYLAFLNRPAPSDAELFAEVAIENRYSGQPARAVVHTPSQPASESVWPEGTRALGNGMAMLRPLAERAVTRVLGFRASRKLRKLLRNPRAFLSESRLGVLRKLGEYWSRR